MSILPQIDPTEFRFQTTSFSDFTVELSVTNPDGSLFRFDNYKRVGDTSVTPLPPTVTFSETRDDEGGFATHNLMISPDPRYASFTLLGSDYPQTFRSFRVLFECDGQHKVTGEVVKLFYGTLDCV